MLIIDKSMQLITLKEFRARSNRKKIKKRVRVKADKLSKRRYRCCNKTRHNARIYKQAIEVDSK
jgi:hypothetical protein